MSLSFRTFRVLWLVGLIFSGGEAFSVAPQDDHYWLETTLTPDHVEKFFRSRCGLSENDFTACVEALNAVGAAGQPATRLVPTSFLGNQALQIGSVIGSFGSFSWVTAPADVDARSEVTGGAAARWRAAVERRTEYLRAVRSQFQQAGQQSLPVSQALSELLARVPADRASAAISASAINAYLGFRVDPHTYIVSIAEQVDQSSGDANNFVGIGAVLNKVSDSVLIVEVIENGPAFRAGLRAGDLIVSVDRVAVAPLSLNDVVQRIRGEAGTAVTLQLLRGGQTVELSIVRGAVRQQNVTSRLIQVGGVEQGYVRLRTFMESSGCSDVITHIRYLTSQGARGLIFDLRGNGGGLVTQAVCIASIFLESGQLVYTMRGLGENARAENYATRSANVTRLPMVTLLDAGSASASELVSGALQDHGRSWVAGERSFGKGSVQAGEEWSFADGIYYFRTIARFFQPSGRTNQLVGIVPDFEIPRVPNPTEDDLFALREGDLYPNALVNSGVTWSQPRPEAVQAVRSSCVGYEARAQQTYAASLAGQEQTVDYTLATATELLACVVRAGHSVAALSVDSPR